ncbi:MAG: iron-containing alcohol dehydrogenase, partial [Gammaproteobacteria bacterium]|nr:iron-containing alcohol dehydrogenase [Gammaproteobacteria bacterium]
PEDIDAQSQALYGAWLGGLTLASVGMALHHKLCHVLGGTFNTPHAETHALMLPYVTALNLGSAPDDERRLTAALGSSAVAGALRDLGQAVGAPESLRALGLVESDLQRAAELVTQAPYYNPRQVTTESIRELLQDAYTGARPRA